MKYFLLKYKTKSSKMNLTLIIIRIPNNIEKEHNYLKSAVLSI